MTDGGPTARLVLLSTTADIRRMRRDPAAGLRLNLSPFHLEPASCPEELVRQCA